MTSGRGGESRRWRAAACALLTGVVAVACAPAESGPPRPGEPARAYAAATLEGDTVSLESLRGNVVLLNLWATWCAPCREETPYLQEIYEDHRDQGFDVVGVSMDTRNQTDAIRMFIDEFDVTYTILHDPAMRGMDLYQALGLPATFLIDREGTLRWLRFGPIPEGDQEFLTALETVLAGR